MISAALQSVCASMGIGRPFQDDAKKSFSDLLFYSYLAGFFSIIAAAWTKTSFAITLLRLSQGWSAPFCMVHNHIRESCDSRQCHNTMGPVLADGEAVAAQERGHLLAKIQGPRLQYLRI